MFHLDQVKAAAAGIFTACLAALISSSPAAAEGDIWTGFYIGGNVGLLHGSVDATPPELVAETTSLVAITPPTYNLRDNAFIGGVQAGYNVLRDGVYVLGIEGDFDWTNFKGAWSQTTVDHYDFYEGDCSGEFQNCDHVVTTNIFKDSLEARLRWLSSIRARAGVLISPELMFYLTGGIAFTEAKMSASSSASINTTVSNVGGCDCTNHYSYNNSYSDSSSKFLVGYVVGGGSELKFDKNWSGRVEFLFYDFGSQNFTLFNSSVKTDIHAEVFRVGLSYTFN